MSRDHTKLRVFESADELLIRLYRATSTFPVAERYGLQSQLRRAAVSVAANIVEGSARRSLGEYVSFLNVASASAAEVAYLLSVVGRLGLMDPAAAGVLESSYQDLLRSLRATQKSLDALRRDAERR